MKCIIRKGYAFYYQGKSVIGGDNPLDNVIDISEDEFKKQKHIFEPPEYAEKLLGKKEDSPSPEDAKKPESPVEKEEVAPEVKEEPESETKVVEEGIVNNRAITKPGKVVRTRKTQK